MTTFPPLHPDDGIQRPHRFAWYVAAGVDCVPFDRNAWREAQLRQLELAGRGAKAKSKGRR
jgi:hypothetical protein